MLKKTLIAAFIYRDRFKWFLEYLKTQFGLEKDNIFIYENEDDSNQLIFTFYLTRVDGKYIDIKKHFKSAIIIHSKRGAYYTINGLNKLIEEKSKIETGNLYHQYYEIGWKKYKNKIILNSNNNLTIINLKRFFW